MTSAYPTVSPNVQQLVGQKDTIDNSTTPNTQLLDTMPNGIYGYDQLLMIIIVCVIAFCILLTLTIFCVWKTSKSKVKPIIKPKEFKELDKETKQNIKIQSSIPVKHAVQTSISDDIESHNIESEDDLADHRLVSIPSDTMQKNVENAKIMVERSSQDMDVLDNKVQDLDFDDCEEIHIDSGTAKGYALPENIPLTKRDDVTANDHALPEDKSTVNRDKSKAVSTIGYALPDDTRFTKGNQITLNQYDYALPHDKAMTNGNSFEQLQVKSVPTIGYALPENRYGTTKYGTNLKEFALPEAKSVTNRELAIENTLGEGQ